jgi:serine protease Do
MQKIIDSSICWIAAALLLSFQTGCVTTKGGGVNEAPKFDLGELGDIFSPKVSEFKNLVKQAKFAEAENLLDREYGFYQEKYRKPKESIPDEFRNLAAHIWKVRYQDEFSSLTGQLSKIDSVERPLSWKSQSELIRKASETDRRFKDERIYKLLNEWPQGSSELDNQIARVTTLFKSGRNKAIDLQVEQILQTGSHVGAYPLSNINEEDFQKSGATQSRLLARIVSSATREDLGSQASRFGRYLSKASKDRVDEEYVALLTKEMKADGRLDLQEIQVAASAKTPFGGKQESLKNIASIGYIDLTAVSFKDRNIFDFEIVFDRDIPVSFLDAKEKVFSGNDLKAYDYLFITDLSAAKISREFKSKKEIKSKMQTGTRQERNPAYVVAQAEYQKAMANFQRSQISSASPKNCYGWGCVLGAVADGIDSYASRSGVDQAAANLASTSEAISLPVYSEYSYEVVDINVAKVAQVDYYLYDVKKGTILKSDFALKDHEKFTVSYNVQDKDPDNASILRNNQSESTVTAWEKKPVTVKLSHLFNGENMKTATEQKLTSFESFLKTLSSRKYATASPTYVKAEMQKAGEIKESSSSYRSQTIADERFDSIVILKSGKSTGTGFYVTPDLVLTAYHVVDKGNLVEMTFYDGTKTYGKVVDHDVRLDLALIKAQTAGKPMKIHSGPIKLGETVEAIGHPKNYEFTITRGVISAIRKLKGVKIGAESLVEFIQTDTPISPGNSGGPLLLKESVIGVNDWIRVDKGSQNLNFSVSYNEIREYLNRFDGKK